jgi:glycosyltransferase involved in cell wall biosynthesis
VRRILLLIKGLGRGGAELLLTASTRHFDSDRFAYEVAYLLPWKDAVAGQLAEAGLSVHCLDGGRGFGWTRRLRALVRTRGFDLVHAHSPYPAVGARSTLRGPVRHVYTEHNVWSSYRPATRLANMLTFGRNDHVFAVSEEVRRSIQPPTALRRRLPPIETLHYGLDAEAVAGWGPAEGIREELGIPLDAPMVCMVGNFRADKGHAVLLSAAAGVRELLPEVRFVLVGLGPLEDEVRARSHQMGLDGTVLFAGFREDAPRIAGASDVFVLPSLREGLPLALLEAMAQGRPVVATTVGGVPEVVEDGRHGLLVPPRDPRALGAALVELLRDPERRRRLGGAARARAAEFDIRRAVRRTEEVYGELLERERPS